MADVKTGEPAFLVNAARLAVERNSIRDVAAQAGLSHGAVHNLITGKTERINGATVRKLRAWYLREWASGGDSLTPEVASYLVEQVLAAIVAGKRRDAAVELVHALEQIYDSHGTPRPAWLGAIRRDSKETGDGA
jgi:AcrR family transcriptional regulator